MDEGLVRALHDAGLGIREVPLRRGGERAGALGGALRLRFRGGNARAGRNQASLAPGEVRGEFIAAPLGPVPLVFGGIDLLGLGEEAPDLLSEPRDLRLHVPVAHGHMLGGVGLDLGPVERHDPELHEASPEAA